MTLIVILAAILISFPFGLPDSAWDLWAPWRDNDGDNP